VNLQNARCNNKDCCFMYFILYLRFFKLKLWKTWLHSVGLWKLVCSIEPCKTWLGKDFNNFWKGSTITKILYLCWKITRKYLSALTVLILNTSSFFRLFLSCQNFECLHLNVLNWLLICTDVRLHYFNFCRLIIVSMCSLCSNSKFTLYNF
jgi:hypothetical protein